MTIFVSTLMLLLLVAGLIWLFLSTPANRLAGLLSTGAPLGLVALGGLLTLLGRPAFGVPLATVGLAWWQRARLTGKSFSPPGRKSTVRTAALEMELDLDTGEMDGHILTGQREGEWLSALSDEELLAFYGEIAADRESAELLEAYLDRRIAGWREDTEAHSAGGEGSTTGAGPMTKQEAYQVLGLEPGASPDEIRKAWRRLMKTMHPDSGGSAFLAAKVNAAKDILLN